MAVEFNAEVRSAMEAAVKGFCAEEFDAELGEVRVRRVFEFFNGLIGSAAYNKGVEDTATYMSGTLDDAAVDLEERVEWGEH